MLTECFEEENDILLLILTTAKLTGYSINIHVEGAFTEEGEMFFVYEFNSSNVNLVIKIHITNNKIIDLHININGGDMIKLQEIIGDFKYTHDNHIEFLNKILELIVKL